MAEFQPILKIKEPGWQRINHGVNARLCFLYHTIQTIWKINLHDAQEVFMVSVHVEGVKGRCGCSAVCLSSSYLCCCGLETQLLEVICLLKLLHLG